MKRQTPLHTHNLNDSVSVNGGVVVWSLYLFTFLVGSLIPCHAFSPTTTTTTATQPSSSSTTTSTSSSTSITTPSLTPWTTNVHLDYSATNEYFRQYYGMDQYFQVANTTDGSTTIYNARHGVAVYDDDSADPSRSTTTNDRHQGGFQVTTTEPTLASCGFCLIHDSSSSSSSSLITDWNDEEQVARLFLPRARHALLQAYASMPDVTVRDIQFWKPTVRGSSSAAVASASTAAAPENGASSSPTYRPCTWISMPMPIDRSMIFWTLFGRAGLPTTLPRVAWNGTCGTTPWHRMVSDFALPMFGTPLMGLPFMHRWHCCEPCTIPLPVLMMTTVMRVKWMPLDCVHKITRCSIKMIMTTTTSTTVAATI